MEIKEVSTDLAPAAIGPYSQAINIGDMVFTSGQLPVDPSTGELDGNDIVTQAKRSLENVKAVLAKEGLTMKNVIKTTVFLQSIADFAAMNEVYASYFEKPFPARSCFEVAELPKAALVEIEVIAVR